MEGDEKQKGDGGPWWTRHYSVAEEYTRITQQKDLKLDDVFTPYVYHR